MFHVSYTVEGTWEENDLAVGMSTAAERGGLRHSIEPVTTPRQTTVEGRVSGLWQEIPQVAYRPRYWETKKA